jgi:hypothetical protein
MSGFEVVSMPFTAPSNTMNAGDTLFGVALCPGTKRPVAGGYEATGNGPQLNLVLSAPSTQGWRISLRNNTTGAVTPGGMRVYVVCAFVQ